MCGIFAYSGPRPVAQLLIKGLKKLEYRGYDSAGMAFFNKGQICRLRVCGGVSLLEQKIQATPPQGGLGIGHTRWATHGAPSEKNAHPHRSHFIYVVHNGVIENAEEIKKIIDSHRLTSETDTELIPHLIYHFCREEKLNFFQSALKCAQWLKGSYAVAAVNEKHPEEIIAFTSGPPLVFCKGSDEFFLSSDLQAMEGADFEMIFLEEDEILLAKKNQFQLFNFKGEKISPHFKKYSPQKTSVSKASHPHFMIKEILEQGQTLSRLILNHVDKNKINLKLSKGHKKDFDRLLKSSSDLFILACGSSYYSALFAKYVLEDIAKIKVNVEMASEFIYRRAFISAGQKALFISQSGETADILTALKQTKQKGLINISLCNVKDSSLDRKSDFALSLLAGPEIAVASTKSFSASLLSLSLLAFYTAKLKGFINLKAEKDFVQQLLTLPVSIEKVLQCDPFFLKIMEKLKSFKAFFYLGRGFYYPIALEGALKLKEIAYLHAEAYPSGEMKHGPLAMVDKKTAIVALLPAKGDLYKKSLINLKEAKSRGACIISIGGKKEDKELEALSDHSLFLPESFNLFQPLLSLIPCQLMAYYISRSYGYNADRPRNLAKSVTVE